MHVFFVFFCTHGALFFQIVQKNSSTKKYKKIQINTKKYKKILKNTKFSKLFVLKFFLSLLSIPWLSAYIWLQRKLSARSSNSTIHKIYVAFAGPGRLTTYSQILCWKADVRHWRSWIRDFALCNIPYKIYLIIISISYRVGLPNFGSPLVWPLFAWKLPLHCNSKNYQSGDTIHCKLKYLFSQVQIYRTNWRHLIGQMLVTKK